MRGQERQNPDQRDSTALAPNLVRYGIKPAALGGDDAQPEHRQVLRPLPKLELSDLVAVPREHEAHQNSGERGPGGQHTERPSRCKARPSAVVRKRRMAPAPSSPVSIAEQVDQQDLDEPHRPRVDERLGMHELRLVGGSAASHPIADIDHRRRDPEHEDGHQPPPPPDAPAADRSRRPPASLPPPRTSRARSVPTGSATPLHVAQDPRDRRRHPAYDDAIGRYPVLAEPSSGSRRDWGGRRGARLPLVRRFLQAPQLARGASRPIGYAHVAPWKLRQASR